MTVTVEITILAMVLFSLGFVPYWIGTAQVKRRVRWSCRALFWSLTVTRRQNGTVRHWTFRVMLIEQLQGMIWGVVGQARLVFWAILEALKEEGDSS